MIFVDSNVPMYLVGAPHPNKDRAIAMLTQLVRDGEHLVTDVQVYQEILHRYTAIQRLHAIDAAFESLDAIVDDVLTFGMAEVRVARELIRLRKWTLGTGRSARGSYANSRDSTNFDLRWRFRYMSWDRPSELIVAPSEASDTPLRSLSMLVEASQSVLKRNLEPKAKYGGAAVASAPSLRRRRC